MPNIPANAINLGLIKPPPLKPNTLRIVPLGGLGEVGRNMTVVEFIDPITNDEPKLLLMDCGVLFPGDNEPGVDRILPDFSYISDRLDRVQALCVTHGHEDHIGAIPYLLKLRPDIPLVGSKFTLELICKKLYNSNPSLHIVKEGDELRFGPFLLNFLPVNHSIPDALAILIKTAAGSILNTGDFKMDQRPLDGRLTDLQRFGQVGAQGVDLFMVDSTNANRPGFVTSETEISTELDRVIGGITSGTIFASTFASHIHRVQGILDAAYRHGKKVVLLGRTMVNNLKIAEELGVIDIPDGLLVAENNIRKVRRDKLIVICTGSQGESLAALARMAAAEHPIINVEQGDTVLLASSLIPGNEKTITELINKLLTQGANVISSANAKVHCSGHANQGELRYIYNVVRPKNVLPIHGEVQHLLANAAVAKETGVPPERIPIIKSGGIVDLRDGRAQVVGRIENGYIFVDGASIGEVSDDDLKNRKMLSAEGFIAITATVDLNSHKVIARPKVVARAVAEDDVVFEKLPEQIQIALEREMSKNHAVDTNRLTYVTKKAVQKFVTKTLRRNPMILPIVSII